MHAFDYASRTSKGAREYQEDTALVWPGPGAGAFAPAGSSQGHTPVVAVLADGMGGHTGGALASRTVCDSFVAAYAKETGEEPHRLLAALDAANRAITQKVEANPMLSGMGSTVIGATFSGQGVHWVSVGDSPLLLYRRGEVAVLNEDHSLAPELDALAAAGKITHAEARNDPRRHMLRSAVTGEDLDMIDLPARPLGLSAGDYVILASDGLQTLEMGEIERVISAYAGDGAEAVAAALIRAVEAIRDPYQDNTTVIAVRVLGPA